MLSFCLFLTLGIFFSSSQPEYWGPETPLYRVLWVMGKEQPPHMLKVFSKDQVEQGEELVKFGRTKGPNGKKSPYISKYFVCTHCHNIEQEDPLLTSRNPGLRLEYSIENDLPFLQGTTFHGMVNRESWYNGDYVKKYGIAAKRAHKSLRESIQLCAVECAQGRVLERWEEDAILAYLWTLEFTLGDLDLSPSDYRTLNQTQQRSSSKPVMRRFLEDKYLKDSPATFVDAPPDKAKGYDFPGDAEIGKEIYRLSCMHCHKEEGPSEYKLDYRTATFRQLRNRIPKDTHFSLYQIVRYGTIAQPGHRPYMPRYTLERMSHKQVEDLRAYIELMAY